jgi:hypothetical protein
MPRLRKPESAIDRLVFFKKATETAANDSEKGESLLTPKTLEKSIDLIARLTSGMGNLAKFESLSQKEIREKNQSMKVLKTYVKDSWDGCRRRVYREQLPLDVFAFYQLPKSGKSPVLTTEGQWLETAELMIKGEADAIESGYAPISNPSISELSQVLATARNEAEDVSEADKLLDKAQESVSDLMPEAAALVDRILAELEFNLFDRDDASKRRIMRNYGVRYELTKNESLEDDTDTQLN